MEARDTEAKDIFLFPSDDSVHNSTSALLILLPDGREISVWSDGSIEKRTTDGDYIVLDEKW